MSSRAYWLPIAIASAVGVPYIASEDQPQSTAPALIRNGGSHQGYFPTPTSTPVPGTGSVSNYPSVSPWQAGAATTAIHPGQQAGPILSATPWMPVGPDGRGGLVSDPSMSVQSGYPTVGRGYLAAPPPTMMAPPGVDPRQALPASEPQNDIRNLFRFDLTPQWIIQNWPRVSSEVSEPPLSGLRTAVVSGTSLNDIAGSMSYYFDSGQQLQRIVFQGTTGDPTAVVRLLASQYGMAVEPALNGACYVARSKDQITSMVRVRNVPLVRHNQPHQRYGLLIELNRPGGSTKLSESHVQMLADEQKMLKPPAEKQVNTPR